ncbi:MAG: ribosome silencing factor [Bacteroidales bacterium]
MVNEKTLTSAEVLAEEVIRGILEKKGLEISRLNLGKIHSTVCDYFIICHGTSSTHVGAIADSVEEQVSKTTGLKPRRKEGFLNAEWILLDYLDVVVHVFQEEVRHFYRLEELWADAPIERISDEDPEYNF